MLHAGFMQATGWPSVVAVMANWYGKGKRGAVMGKTPHVTVCTIKIQAATVVRCDKGAQAAMVCIVSSGEQDEVGCYMSCKAASAHTCAGTY